MMSGGSFELRQNFLKLTRRVQSTKLSFTKFLFKASLFHK